MNEESNESSENNGINASDESIHHPYDKSYKFLLSSKRIFVELLQSFVAKGWVERIDEQHLTKVDKSYILQDFREKEADLVYRMRLKGRQVIFYILMEMQSSVDFQMPYRLLLYMTEIWRDVLKNTEAAEAARKDFRLPAIVPIVLYNGRASWTACRSFRETLDSQEWFGDELLDFKYILIDVHDYEEKQLLELSNLIGVVLLLERQPGLHAFMEQMERLTNVLEKLPQDVFPIFQSWIKLATQQALSEENKRRVSEIIDQFAEPKEARAMISHLGKAIENEFKEWKEKYFEEGIEKGIERGIEKGIEQGIEKGIEKGKAEVAVSMLKKGMDIATIVELTGLTLEEVEKLKKFQ